MCILFRLTLCCFAACLILSSDYAFAQNSSNDVDARFKELGFDFAEVGKPGAIYKRVVVVGNMAYTSGHIAIDADADAHMIYTSVDPSPNGVHATTDRFVIHEGIGKGAEMANSYGPSRRWNGELYYG